MTYPTVYLAIDNCFASKRWTAPADWAAIVRDLGLACVEASADNECDALYAEPSYLADWLDQCRQAADRTGVRVVNFYSGHGTYATLGMGHTDPRCRDRIQHAWLERMIDSAAALGAGIGFYCHAFCQEVLQTHAAYRAAEEDLYRRLAELADYAAARGLPTIGLEQMYTPHQVPWTIEGAGRLLRKVFNRKDRPFYLTLDTGHQTGQRMFLRPSAEQIAGRLEEFSRTGRAPGLWLGPDRAYATFARAAGASGALRQALLDELAGQMDDCGHLFAVPHDGDLYAWARQIGCYSPIVHLQQTDGAHSAHWPFTEQYNARGIVEPGKLLRALAEAYQAPEEAGCPPRCGRIYLTLEIFSRTADIPADILARLSDSVACWRRFIPRDGLGLDQLVARL